MSEIIVKTNLMHVKECLEKAGYKVDDEWLKSNRCPPQYSDHASPYGECVAKYSVEVHDGCENCEKWWDEEYKGDGLE